MTNTLSPETLVLLNHYLHFKIGTAHCSVPYVNNKTVGARGALAVHVGKGSPLELTHEIRDMLFKHKISADTLTNETLKKMLVEHNLGIDCSGFVYHLLNTEMIATGRTPLKKHISFIQARGLFGKMNAVLHPAKATGVLTLVDNVNSHIVALADVAPGDFITLVDNSGEGERDHILLIHEVISENSKTKMIHYSHSVAYPEDGLYGTGVRQGRIDTLDSSGSILSAQWSEQLIFNRAQKSHTEIRRLKK
mgnify:CR=1 FL=1